MKKLYLFFISVLVFSGASAQQQILLLTETFENGTNSFNFDTGGVGTNVGNNQWLVNDVYSGAPLYPNTPPQDSVVSGQINAAPFSRYLHIHDAASGITNANWNSTTASDRFTFIGSSFCTLAMTDVIFTFFWVCEGDSNAYGEVYYRIDGGAWIKTGRPKYNNQSKWLYESIQDPAFNNVQNLQFGFRWVNPAAGTSNVSFGIDDIIAVGTYDDVNNPVTLSINLISPLQICQDDYLLIGYTLSDLMCDGIYEIQMSNSAGNFTNPVSGGVFHIYPPDTFGYVSFQVPSNVTGNCFRIRINRLSPLPRTTGVASVCFSIIDCPEQIFTSAAPVMNDIDTTCIQSVIDVKFYSYGVYGPGNTYTAQLSDANGSFATPYQLGTLPDDDAHPGPPGNVSGLIPQNVPPGCGYYIRIISNIPATIGTRIGPFCLTQCDELTNNTQDIHVCLNGSTPYPEDANLNITINHWNNDASYDTCNDWRIELRSMMDFSLVNIGALGVYHDSIGGNFVIDFPPFEQQLIARGVQPGAYYLRIVSDCSNLAWNQNGTVVRITIGAPDTLRPTISLIYPGGPQDTAACNFGIVPLWNSTFNHPPSDYEWTSNGLNNGLPFIWPENPLLVNFTNAPLDDYIFYVREINFGCTGTYSDEAVLTIISAPNVFITGDTVVCLGDTVTYNVGFIKETYYDWDAPPGVKILVEGNSQVTMIFDTIGTFTISNFSLNICGGDSGFYNVTVTTPYSINAGNDTIVCSGQPISLTAETQPVQKEFFTKTNTTTAGRQGAMFNIISHGDVVIDSFAVKYMTTTVPVQQEIWGKTGTYRTFEQISGAWNSIGANTFAANPNTQFTIIPIAVNQPIAGGDTFAFYITTANTAPTVSMQYSPGLGLTQEVLYKTDGVIDFIQGTINTYFFGPFSAPRVLNVRIYYTTSGGTKYLWNTGDTTATILFNPTQTKDYSVTVFDSSGCKNSDTLSITVKPIPITDAGPDASLCIGDTVQLNGTPDAPDFSWTPPVGLSDTAVSNPLFIYDQTTKYYLNSKGVNECNGIDSVTITVNLLPEVNAGLDTVLCDGLEYTLSGTSTASTVEWIPAAGLDSASKLNPVFTSNQTTTYVLTTVDTFGCKQQDSVTIVVGATPTINAGLDKVICDDETYTVEAVSNGTNIIWSPSEGLSNPNILNPVFSGADTTEYVIIATDTIGCTISDTVILGVKSCDTYIKVPQAFTPNDDGSNDHFTVFGKNIEQYEIKIFNRWGEVVYSSRDVAELSDLSRGWDGTYKGKLQEVGTFVYFITAKDIFGKTLEPKKGNVTLIR